MNFKTQSFKKLKVILSVASFVLLAGTLASASDFGLPRRVGASLNGSIASVGQMKIISSNGDYLPTDKVSITLADPIDSEATYIGFEVIRDNQVLEQFSLPVDQILVSTCGAARYIIQNQYVSLKLSESAYGCMAATPWVAHVVTPRGALVLGGSLQTVIGF